VRPRLSRVRGPEWIVGAASVALLVVLFATTWYRLAPASERVGSLDRTGWQSLSILGPLALVVGILGLVLWWLQLSRRAPALPVSSTVVEMLLAFVMSLGLLVRVFIDHPAGGSHVRLGGYVGFALAVVVAGAAFRSLRKDGIAPADAPREIELIRLEDLPGAGSPSS
jgi:hypothetical protein